MNAQRYTPNPDNLTQAIETIVAIWGNKRIPPDPGLSRDEYDAEIASNVLDKISDADLMRREQIKRGRPPSVTIEEVERARRNVERARKPFRWN